MILGMTREDAERRASALNAQGSGGRWFAREGADGWNVVKVALLPAFHRHFDGPYHV